MRHDDEDAAWRRHLALWLPSFELRGRRSVDIRAVDAARWLGSPLDARLHFLSSTRDEPANVQELLDAGQAHDRAKDGIEGRQCVGDVDDLGIGDFVLRTLPNDDATARGAEVAAPIGAFAPREWQYKAIGRGADRDRRRVLLTRPASAMTHHGPQWDASAARQSHRERRGRARDRQDESRLHLFASSTCSA